MGELQEGCRREVAILLQHWGVNKMTCKVTKLAAAGALLVCTTASAALAGSVTQPGETVGAPAGAPLTPGVYFINTADWGCRNTSPDSTCLGVDIPVIEWATSWKILGGRLQFVVATPVVEVGVHHTNYLRGVYNPLFAGMLAWDLGNGFGVSYLVSAYADVKTEVAWSSSSLNQRFALSYTGYGWDLTANVIWGIQRDSVSVRPQLSPCPAQFVLNGCNPNFLNVDLTATKKFGKWEFGPVAYYSTDLNSPVVGYQKQSQTAVGALLGYNFGPVILQSYLTREVSERNYGGLDTRLWTRVIIPLVVEQPAPTRAARVRGS
jgi:hypothetical protein